MMLRRARRLFSLLFAFVAIVALLAPEWPAFGDSKFQFELIVGRDRRFDFITWTAEALGMKTRAMVAGVHRYLPPDVKKAYVLDYLQQIGQAQQLEREIELVYTDPAVSDPATAAVKLRAQRDALRSELTARRPLAEAIVQDQVAALLVEEGLAVGGATWPPVMMTMSPVPYMLIVSPRDRIAQIDSAALIPGLTTEAKEELETAVLDRLDQSALVVPIGGLGTYPAMISETSSINWLAQVTAHEWTHHWLSLRPLGMRYLQSPQMRTINETVASLVDLEIGPLVIDRYYPEFVPQPSQGAPQHVTTAPPAFDFGAEMAATRATVDQLLAAGEIEAAEAYMEQQRQVFVAHGYAIRKLNQAYFAFYGGYAAQPGGAAGADPIGPLLRQLRVASPSLRAFLRDVGGLTSYEDLLALYRARIGEEPAVQ
jgi:hypothetical protein